MNVTRREFLAVSGALGAGLALSTLGIDLGPAKAYADEVRINKLKSAKHAEARRHLSVLRRRLR